MNVLFLAIGFLEWVDEDGEPASSPLLLLPCDLHRASPRDHFTLTQDDEDLTSNSTLAVKLTEFGVELPDSESEVEDVGAYLDLVRQSITTRPDWHVTEEIYLAPFAYSKLAMWRDLNSIKQKGTDHPIVLTLTGGDPTSPRDPTPSALLLALPQDLSGGRLVESFGMIHPAG